MSVCENEVTRANEQLLMSTVSTYKISNSPEIKNDNINPINNGILYSCWGSAQHYGTTTGGLQV